MHCSQGYLRNHHPHVSIPQGKLSREVTREYHAHVRHVTTQRLVTQEVRGSRSQPIRVENKTSAEQCKTFKRRGLRLKHQEVVMFERFQT